MPDFSALSDLLGAVGDLLSGLEGFVGSVENPLPSFLTKG